MKVGVAMDEHGYPRLAHADGGEQPRQIGALTGLRFLAALAVVLDHYWLYFVWWDPALGVPSAAAPVPAGWLRLVHGGGLGVDSFFVLSGFILAYIYASDTAATGMRGSRGAFWIARLARVYPVYLVGLAVALWPFLMQPHRLATVLAAMPSTVLLVQAWVPSLNTFSGWNSPGWSLSAEAFFYLLLPVLLLWLARRYRRTLWVVAGAITAGYALIPLPLMVLVRTAGPGLDWWVDTVFSFNPLLRLPEFALGVTLGLLYLHRQPTARLGPRAMALWRLPGWAIDTLLLALGASLAAAQFVPLPPHYPINPVVLPLFAAVVVCLARERGLIAWLLSRRAAAWLGEISYGIYIFHAPLWAWLAWLVWTAWRVPPGAAYLLPVYLAGVILVAGLSYRFIERPARHAIRARWSAWQARRQPVTVSSFTTGHVTGEA